MKQEINLTDELIRLHSLSIFELRTEWRRQQRLPPPMRLSRDLLIRAIAYKLQERAEGGLSKATLRRLHRLGTKGGNGGDPQRPSGIVPMPGTRLVREWHGATHSVLVHADGFEWRGQRYRSLSVIARAITGAHWSGPRFFGLMRRSASVPDKAGNADGHV